ncbi:putative methyltransferase PMT16 [Morus notabilis]|uniref:Methyltransferase n=1 Tax=Morus notabilis TaxID=981085 RepID=W9QSG0_9ROSA|nr:putative methyltransferase PMT16 [Morus notabilis]
MPNGQTRCQDNYWLQGQESLSSGTGKSFPRSCKYGRRTHYRDSPVDCFIDIPRVFPTIMSLGRHIAATAGQVEKLLLTPSIEILASIGLSYPSREFDMAHISRCLIPYGDQLYLIEDVRILHPGGYYWISTGLLIVSWERQWKGWEKTEEDLQAEQLEIEVMEKGACWKELEQKDNLALVIWQKPANHVHRDQNPVMACFTIMENCLAPLMQNERGLNEVADGKLVKWPGKLTLVPPIHECGLMGTYQNCFLVIFIFAFRCHSPKRDHNGAWVSKLVSAFGSKPNIQT